MKISPPETSYFLEIMNLRMFIIGNMFSLLTKITSHYYLWFFLLLLSAIVSHAAPTHGSDIKMGNGNQAIDVLSLLNNEMENASFVTFSTERFEVNMFEHSLGDYENELH